MPEPKILIVEDEEDLAENLADLLELEGYTTKICLSGEEALEEIKTSLPDIALLDIQLPEIDGIEVLRRLKELQPTLPVVMVSASSQRGMGEKIKEYGADGMIMKPYDQDELLQLIEELLTRGRE